MPWQGRLWLLVAQLSPSPLGTDLPVHRPTGGRGSSLSHLWLGYRGGFLHRALCACWVLGGWGLDPEALPPRPCLSPCRSSLEPGHPLRGVCRAVGCGWSVSVPPTGFPSGEFPGGDWGAESPSVRRGSWAGPEQLWLGSGIPGVSWALVEPRVSSLVCGSFFEPPKARPPDPFHCGWLPTHLSSEV